MWSGKSLRWVGAVVVAFLLVASSATSPALAAPYTTESRAQELGNYVKHKVGDVVDSVRNKIGLPWGNARVESADAKIVGRDGKEIEYVRVRPAGSEQAPGGWMDRAKEWWTAAVPWGHRGGGAALGLAKDSSHKLYETAADVRNAAGETWDQAVHKAYEQWYAAKRSTRESWDDAKKAAWDAWSATTDASQRTADAITGKAKGATEASKDAALDTWHQAMASAYHNWYTTKDKTRQSWKDAKNAAWKSWKATQGKAAQGYDFLADSTSNAYESAMQKAYDTWKVGAQKSGETWDAASDAFHRLYRSAASTSPETALADAWDQWQATKSETGETWDEAKKKAMDDYNRIRTGMGAGDSRSVRSLQGWEPWLRSTWHRWTSRRSNKLPSGQETWDSARDAAYKSYQAVSSLADQSWDQAREAARRAYYKAASTTKGDESWADAEVKAWQRWLEARAYQGKANFAELQRAADSYWADTKGKSREGYDDFMASLWDAWSKARSAGGGTAEEIESAAKEYYDSTKSSVKQTYDAISDAAWQTWLAATAQRGVTFEDIQDSVKSRWENTKKRTKGTYKDFEDAARKAYDQAASQGEHSWLHNVSDAISCAWDDTKCRGASAWEGIKHTFKFDKGGGGHDLGGLRDEAHRKVDELYGVAKAEL